MCHKSILYSGAARLKATSDSVLREKQEVEQLKSRLDSIAEDRSLDSISAILQAAVQEAEDDSEVNYILNKHRG